ncbi:MAG TPA: PKD domain-containing protein [Chryseolinea sp.]
MKKFLIWIGLLIVGTTLQQCKNDGADPAALQKVQFTFGLRSTQPSGGRTEATAQPTALLLSLENSIGDPVFTSKRIALLHVGTSLMTEPIELAPGTYTITDFLLVDDDNVVLYATPKAGSPLASAVAHPLPYGFTVSSDDVSTVDMEVVDVSQNTPEDFGYATFNISLVNTLRVAVFISTNGVLSLTTADALLNRGDEVVGSYALAAKTNILAFSGAPDASYRLLVAKEGYPTYIKDFVYSELIASLHGEPLKIVLNQFTIQPFLGESLTFQADLTGTPHEAVDVYWGDGASDHLVFNPDTGGGAGFSHTYATPGDYTIAITGALDAVNGFHTAYGLGAIEAIDFQALPNLQSLTIVLTHGPETLDLTQNPEISFVHLEGVPELKHVLLPDLNHVSFIDIDGPNQISTADVDAIIEKIHSAATVLNTLDGRFELDQSWMIPTNIMVGPPSPASVDMLQDLRNNYNWTILPDPGS